MHKKLNILHYFKSHANKYKYVNRYLDSITEDFKSVQDIFTGGGSETVYLEDIYVPLKLKEIYREPGSLIEKERVTDSLTALENYGSLVILGVPGAGKTTLLKHLVLEYCKKIVDIQTPEDSGENIDIPVFITLRELSDSEKGLKDFIDGVFEKYGVSKAKKLVEKKLKTGNCTLLLDGFDEAVTPEKKEKVIKEVRAFAEKYPGCKILVTSGIAGYYNPLSPGQEEPFGDFKRLEIMEFDDHQVKQFMDKRCALSNRGRTGPVLKVIMENNDIRAFAGNPLMLSTIIRCDEDDESLPKRAGLYRRIIDVMLDEWDDRKGGNRFSPDQKEFILRKLAFRNHSRVRRTLTEKEILEEIAKNAHRIGLKSEACADVLREIWERSYLLKPLSLSIYDFSHFSMQEYFAALELSRQENGLALITPHLSESWWEGAILLYAGVCKNADPLVRQIRKNAGDDIFYSSLMLSGRCIAEAGFVDPLLKEEIVQELWLLYNTGEFQLLKQHAAAVLARIKPRRMIDMLVNQLTDKEPHTRKTAAESLGIIGGAEILPTLIMVLVKDKESKVRSHAAVALGKIGSVEAVFPLINTLNNDKDSEVRKSAAEALGLIGSTAAVSALVKTLTNDKNSRVRGGAAEALGEIGNTDAVPQLIRALVEEREKSVRWRIAKALGKPGTREVHEVLIKALQTDKDTEVRESAAEALGVIGSTEGIDALVRALVSDKAPDVRGSAAYALGFMRNKEALPVLLRALIADTNGEVRGRAAYALGRLKNIEAIPFLTAVFSTHKDSFIRGNTIFALGEIGEGEAVPFLTQALTHDKDPYVRYRAAEVLGSIGNAMTIPMLKIALEDDGSYYGWRVKDKAFEALEKISRRLHVKISKD